MPLSAPAMAAETNLDYDSTIDKLAETYIEKTVLGVCVIVAEHGNVVFSKSYGYADLEKQIPIEPNFTAFERGSISKTFVWVSVMQQVEAG